MSVLTVTGTAFHRIDVVLQDPSQYDTLIPFAKRAIKAGNPMFWAVPEGLRRVRLFEDADSPEREVRVSYLESKKEPFWARAAELVPNLAMCPEVVCLGKPPTARFRVMEEPESRRKRMLLTADTDSGAFLYTIQNIHPPYEILSVPFFAIYPVRPNWAQEVLDSVSVLLCSK